MPPLLHWLSAMLLLVHTFGIAAAPPHVVVLLSEEGGAYAEVATAVRDTLERDGKERYKVSLAVAGKQPNLPELLRTPDVSAVVTVGMKAATATQSLALSAPVIYTLIPKVAVDRLLALRQPAVRLGVYLDQPFDRQLELIRLTVPGMSRIGVIFGPDSVLLGGALESSATSLGMKLESETVAKSSELPGALQRLLERSQVLLALPDPEVLNKSTVHNLLLSAYRSGDPVFAFSSAYVKAGALAAVYSSPSQIGAQAADMLLSLPGRAVSAEGQYPKYFTVTVNRTVARSMGISVDEDDHLQERLQRHASAGR